MKESFSLQTKNGRKQSKQNKHKTNADETMEEIHLEQNSCSEIDDVIETQSSDTMAIAFQEEKLKIFEDIYDEFGEIELPTTQWAIHRDPDHKFIAFSLFNPMKSSCTRLLIIDNQFNAQTMIDGKLVSSKTFVDLSPKIISDTLTEIDEYK